MSEINDTKELPKGKFSLKLKTDQTISTENPSLLAKNKMGTYHKGYFYGGSNINLNLITCEDKIVIPSILQSYVLNWYNTYLLNPGMDRTEAMICQKFYSRPKESK